MNPLLYLLEFPVPREGGEWKIMKSLFWLLQGNGIMGNTYVRRGRGRGNGGGRGIGVNEHISKDSVDVSCFGSIIDFLILYWFIVIVGQIKSFDGLPLTE
jgi:hypothetical protein